MTPAKWLKHNNPEVPYFGNCVGAFKISRIRTASAIKRMYAIPDATPVAAELLGDAKWKRGGKSKEKPADVQQVGKSTAEARCCESALERTPRVQRTAIDDITSGEI